MATLIHTSANGSQRYYKLDFKVRNYKLGNSIETIEGLFKSDPLELKEGKILLIPEMDYVDCICISDAHTHAERLVFPAMQYYDVGDESNIKVSHRNNNIGGKMTMMIHGGDTSAMYSDEVYIRNLRRYNAK
jgi:hypothetical protein